MKLALASKKVFITSIDSFTGRHLSVYLKGIGYDVYGSSQLGGTYYKCDITSKADLLTILDELKPDYIINLAGIAFVAHGANDDFYSVNTIGAINILEALVELKQNPTKVILASSAVVYGAQSVNILDELLTPNPVNHYGMSKYAMELLAKSYFDKLNIIITRPFNYTGVGQSENFVIPKIVNHYRQKKPAIELGNIDVYREYNDVEYVCEVYEKLLQTNSCGEVVNICSGKTVALNAVLELMNDIAGYKIDVAINQAFVRKNEIKSLYGSTDKLLAMTKELNTHDLKSTLKKIYEA
jgi:nucleoside-diphosphate-sugar epimerase